MDQAKIKMEIIMTRRIRLTVRHPLGIVKSTSISSDRGRHHTTIIGIDLHPMEDLVPEHRKSRRNVVQDLQVLHRRKKESMDIIITTTITIRTKLDIDRVQETGTCITGVELAAAWPVSASTILPCLNSLIGVTVIV